MHEEGVGFECVSVEELRWARRHAGADASLLFTPNFCPVEEYREAFEGGAEVVVDGGHVFDLDADTIQDPGDFLTGKTTYYEYDGSNRLTEVLRPADGATGTWKWEYDSGGKVTKHTKAGDDITLTYDGVNRKVTVVDRESVEKC